MRSALRIARTGLMVATIASAMGAQTSATYAAKSKGAQQPAADASASGATGQVAQTPAAAVETASALLKAGKIGPVIDRLTTIISAGQLPPQIMARALYLRGMAYRQQSKPALAISDLTSALWLKDGLSAADRTDATQQRASAYTDAGLSDYGQALQSAKPFVTTVAPSAPAMHAAAPLAHAPASAEPVAKIATAATIRPAAGPTAAHPTAAPRAGKFLARVTLVRTKAEAEAAASSLKARFGAVLGTMAPEIEPATFGNMGSYYQVRIGPFTTIAAATALCARLEGSGYDCVAVDK